MTDTQKPMTRTEARDLKALVRSEYRVLGDEVQRRAMELTREAEEWYEAQQADTDKALKPFQRRLAKLEREFKAEVKKLTKEIEATGLVLSPAPYNNKAEFAYTEVNWSRWTATEVGGKTFRDVEHAIYMETHRVERELERTEQNMIRDLTLRTLGSDEAVEFFHSIPTAETLLPRPDVMAALNGG